MKFLVIDDDNLLREYICGALQEMDARVDQAADAERGYGLAMAHRYDAIVLDYMLPDRTGVELVREMRAEGRVVPVLMVTVRDSEEDVIRALDAGADDYVVKPFAMGELKARLRALLRRGERVRAERLQQADLTLDRLSRTARSAHRELSLTPKEFALLEQLLLHPGRTLPRAELLQTVWDLSFDPGSNVVDVHISRLRRKLRRAGSAVELSTVRGVGFMLQAPESAASER